MNIQINNDFQLALSVFANGTAEPLASATDIEVVVQNIDAPRVRCALSPAIVNGNVVTVAVDSNVLNATGRYIAVITYAINGARRYAENGDAFTLVRSAAEADIEGESTAIDLHVKFEASGINGLSAYELAKQAGYAGTFEQWLYAGENANNAAAKAAGAANQATDAANAAYGASGNALSAAARANAAAETANTAAAGISGEVTRLDTRITEETARAESAEDDILALLKGESTETAKSNAMTDPFTSLGVVEDVGGMLDVLDGLCSDKQGTNDYGKFRINLNGVNVYVTNYILGRDYQVFAQEIYAPIEIRSVVAEEKSYPTADKTDEDSAHITRKYAQKLQVVTNWRATGSSRTLRRTHHVDNGWSNWVDTSNPYITSPLYGKNILLIGGSFAHNMRAFMNGELGFTIDKKDYSMQNYLAEQLGLNHLDNFAISGEGSCITEGVFLKRNTLEQFKLARQKAEDNGYSYDAIILVGGLNDFQKSVPVGKLSDASDAGTFCAGLKALTNEIRTKKPTAKILFTTPFKATYSEEPWEDAFWNPLSKKTNSAGCRFAEYIQAIKEVAHLRSIPLLDIYSICQIDGYNAGKLLYSDLVHPNGQGYLTIAPAMLDFIAWQKGSAVFCNDALQMNLKQELGDAITVSEKNAVEKGRQLALRDLFIAAGAEYNDTDADKTKTAPWGGKVKHLAGHYYLNGLGDITEEQMMAIYNVGNRGLRELAYTNELTRTFITKRAGNTSYAYESSLRGCFFACNNIETLGDNTESLYCKNSMEGLFRNCLNLKYINMKLISVLYATSITNMFKGCAALVRVLVQRIAKSISFADSKDISQESILYAIENAAPTTAIIITLHADAYARLKNDAEIVAALEAQPLVTLVSA